MLGSNVTGKEPLGKPAGDASLPVLKSPSIRVENSPSPWWVKWTSPSQNSAAG